ncbi:hypothetical protein ABGB07_13865 [Micromonosporaceae bacterium B7E4]
MAALLSCAAASGWRRSAVQYWCEEGLVEIRFDFGDERGRVLVEVVPNTDPVAVGKSERDLGMPGCTASVEFSARGYRSLLGWVQLVREPGAADRFEIDPFDLFADSSAPFAWHGFRPVLFDAPSRWRTGAVHGRHTAS